ncbi:MAG: ABC transporter permease [Lachnospiraceae bacterium]|nr:ABC transporter permease [Lachnospiraceae bacterium]
MYAKLVIRNAKRSVKEYLVYLVTMTICVTLFYSFLSISSKYYQPDIGMEYNFRILGDGMKYAICAVTLLLIFLINYVNQYMLRSRQKEFAVQAIMGMEQKTIGMLFLAETFVMGITAIMLGIILGMFGSQFITAMVLSTYNKDYRLTWTLFPDTVLLTIGFFVLSFAVVGFFNLRVIRKIKIIDMLSADRENEPSLEKSRQIPVMVILFEMLTVWMLVSGIEKKYFYFDSRMPFPVHIMFWGNILFPAVTLLWSVIWFIRKRWSRTAVMPAKTIGSDGMHCDNRKRETLLAGLLICALLHILSAASVPSVQNEYYLSMGTGTVNQYMMFVLGNLLFVICAVIYLANTVLVAWKERSPEHRYRNQNLFFYGQITTKLSTANKTMTLISVTLVTAIFLLMAAPILIGWANGYLEMRAKYDVQISTGYTNVYEEEELPRDDYGFVTDYLEQNGITTAYDLTFNLYLPKRDDFHNRVKYDFPAVAISLHDYNMIREMLGYEAISLGENEFTTQWQSIATEDDRDEFLWTHKEITTDAGSLTLAEKNCYTDAMGETLYNYYTDVLLVLPDSVCEQLLPVNRDRYIMTTDKISYLQAQKLEELFRSVYPESTGIGAEYRIRTSTLQISSTKANMFVLQAVMLYGAVVLMVICFTVLSLQQLLDSAHYRYRFSVLRKLGVEEKEIGHLVLQQLGVWFGLPVTVAVCVSAVIVAYYMQSVSAQIMAYIGVGALLAQMSLTGVILLLLLFSYFISTWILFKGSVSA